ncbi:MAG TPA: Ldh family oxidoreductase [bacterium]|nr:Ldh family oxidoreductase [bacterium]
MTTTYHHFEPDALQIAVSDVFQASGSPTEEAALIARRLVQANLAGHDSHGTIRVHQYLERLRKGMIRPGQQLTPLREVGPTAVYSANRGYGQVGATLAMEQAIARARTANAAAVGLTDVNHIGRLADYAIMASEADMIGMVLTSSGGFSRIVAPFGSNEGRISTNPMAVAFPSDRPSPVVLDMATSAWANGKFKVMIDNKWAAPEGLLFDKQGRPTTDPSELYEGGAIRPLGAEQGYKGTLLAVWVEILAGMLTGGGVVGSHNEGVTNNTTMMIALNVAAFRELPAFKAELEQLIAYLKATRPAPGGEVLWPGELEARVEAQRRAEGIPLAEDTVRDLQDELTRYGVATRLADLALRSEAGALPGVG